MLPQNNTTQLKHPKKWWCRALLWLYIIHVATFQMTTKVLHFRRILSCGTCELSTQVTVLCEKIWDSNYLYLHSDEVLSILSNWKYSYSNIVFKFYLVWIDLCKKKNTEFIFIAIFLFLHVQNSKFSWNYFSTG